MPKEIIVRLAAIAVAVVGAVVIWYSTIWGVTAYGNVVRAVGGLGGVQVELAAAGTIVAFRTMGAILLGVGLFRALEYPARD